MKECTHTFYLSLRRFAAFVGLFFCAAVVSADDASFSFVILSDPQVWRAHSPKNDEFRQTCPEDPDGGVINGNDVACAALKFQCSEDLITRSLGICGALRSHDAVVDTINTFFGDNSYWPTSVLCAPFGTASVEDGCISRGAGHQLQKPSSVIINGDLTENFTSDEIISYAKLYGSRLEQIWPGLGNHDYENMPPNWREDSGVEIERRKQHRLAAESMANLISFQPQITNYDLIGVLAVSNRTLTSKGFRVRASGKNSVIRSLKALETRYIQLGDVNEASRQPWRNIEVEFFDRRLRTCGFLCLKFVWVSIDKEPVNNSSEAACFDVGPLGALKTPCITREGNMDRIGSLSYSFDKGRYRFIQLQNYLGFEVDLTDDRFAPRDPPIVGPRIQGGFDIRTAEGWLASELTKATALGQAIVINLHNVADQHELQRFIEANNFNNVVAVFAGHEHQKIGKVAEWENQSGHKVPVILSGASLAGTMLYVEFFENYFNWAAVRAWSADDANDPDSTHREGASSECDFEPSRRLNEIRELIHQFVAVKLFDDDLIQGMLADLETDKYDTRCFGRAAPVYIADSTWTYFHDTSLNFEKQGTVTFDFSGSPGTPNTPPVASCVDKVVHAGASCSASVSVDAGSYDPDGGQVALRQSPVAPYGLGENRVTLTALDENGAVDSCEAIVTVVDVDKPQVFCGTPATIAPPDTPISFQATGADNCGVPNVHIDSFSCHRINGAGKQIDLEGSCNPAVLIDTMTITKSNGIGTRFTWSPKAEDESGNVTSVTCHVDIVNRKDLIEPGLFKQREKNRK